LKSSRLTEIQQNWKVGHLLDTGLPSFQTVRKLTWSLGFHLLQNSTLYIRIPVAVPTRNGNTEDHIYSLLLLGGEALRFLFPIHQSSGDRHARWPTGPDGTNSGSRSDRPNMAWPHRSALISFTGGCGALSRRSKSTPPDRPRTPDDRISAVDLLFAHLAQLIPEPPPGTGGC